MSTTDAEIKRDVSAVRASPHNARLLLALAEDCADTNSVLAFWALRRCLAISPQNVQALRDLADLFRSKEYTDRELETLNKLLVVAPNDQDAMLRSADILMQVDEEAAAAKLIKRAVALNPMRPSAALLASMLYYRLRMFNVAVKTLAPIVKAHPLDASLQFQLSELLRVAGDIPAAQTAIAAATRIDPRNGTHYRQFAHILLSSATPSAVAPEAETFARKAIALGDTSTDARYWLAVALDTQGKSADALAAYMAVGDTSYERTAYRLGRLYQLAGKQQLGGTYLRQFAVMDSNLSRRSQAFLVLRHHPELVINHLKMASEMQRVGQDGLAITVLKRAELRFGRAKPIEAQLRRTLAVCGRGTEAAHIHA